uniref:Uncharacterized protein n=1 Tax=Cacopsylla melanoneura TaxID=428564 RepID=A0A8D8YQB2_9HEMI
MEPVILFPKLLKSPTDSFYHTQGSITKSYGDRMQMRHSLKRRKPSTLKLVPSNSLCSRNTLPMFRTILQTFLRSSSLMPFESTVYFLLELRISLLTSKNSIQY